MPSRVHGSSRPAASPATSTRPRRTGEPVARQRVRWPESSAGSMPDRPRRSRNARRYPRVGSPCPRAAMTPTVSRVVLGEHPAVRAGQRSPVDQQPAAPVAPDRPGYRQLHLQPEVDLSTVDTDVPAGDTGGAVGADHGTGAHHRPVAQPQRHLGGGLLDRAAGGALPYRRARRLRGPAQHVVELLAAHHRDQRRGRAAGEAAPAVVGERGRGYPVAGHRTDRPGDTQRGDRGEGRADQPAAAGLVPRVHGPLQYQRPGAGTGRDAGGGETGRPAAHHRHIPELRFRHPHRVGVPFRHDPSDRSGDDAPLAGAGRVFPSTGPAPRGLLTSGSALPEESPMTFYVTTTIPYVNGRPHLGHALELVQADALARHRRRRGDRVRFLSGTDDNSLKNVLAAQAEGVPTAQLVDRNAAVFAALHAPLSLSFDDFIRTSRDPRHRPGVERLWRACAAAGDLYRKHYTGRYCVGCEQFYPPAELPDGRCPEHGTEPVPVAEENWFFRLSRYQDRLYQLISD